MERKKKTTKKEVDSNVEKLSDKVADQKKEKRSVFASEINFQWQISFVIDLKFWDLLPALAINGHSGELEIEFLCFGVSFKFK